MKLLTVCDQGNNRSVQFSHLLKYLKHDTIPIGLKTTSKDTLTMLYNWADKIILTEKIQSSEIPIEYKGKIKLYDVGPDIYPRPFNQRLNFIAKKLIKDNPI